MNNKIYAYAKINVGLRVVNKRNDGYHNLVMVNDLIDVCDIITISKYDKFKLVFNENSFNYDLLDEKKEKLILNITEDFCKKYQIKDCFLINITKNIPLGSGLGGFSSCAANIIIYINKEYKLNLSNQELIDFCKKYSADIPYFIVANFNHSLYIVKGIGDILEKTNMDVYLNRYVIYPNINVDTSQVFKNNLIYNKEEVILYNNDLEQAAFNIYKDLSNAKKELEKYFKIVVMSGSGSSFVCYDNIKDIEILKQEKPNWLFMKGNRPWEKK